VAAADCDDLLTVDLRAAAIVSSRKVSVRVVLATVILVELFALYLVLDQSSWAYDDNFYLVLAGQEGFAWHWLSSVQFEHWDIGEHVLISLQHRLFFFDYRWALAVMLGLLGGSIYLFERVLATLVRTRWITIAFALWFGLCILWVRPLQWWAAGVQYFPYTLLDLLCLYGFMRFHAAGQRRWLGISGVALAAALLFYEKPAYMLLYLVLLRVLLMSEDLRPRAVLADFWRERAVWITYTAIIAVWGIGYINSHAYTSHGSVHVGQYLTYFRILWLQTLVPSLASLTIPASRLDGLQIFFVVASQVAVLVCFVISLRRKRSAWRAWAFLATIILLSGVLVAHSRVSIFGVDIANDPRYLIDFSWLVPLALCAAFTPGNVLKPRAPKPSVQLQLSSSGFLVPVVVVLLLVYAGGAIASGIQLEKVWAGPQAREWEKRVRSGIAALERSGQRPMVANNVTPFEIMAEFVAPYNRLSRVLPMYVGPIQIDGPLDAPLVRIANDGTVHRAEIVAAGSGGALLDLVRSHRVNVGPGGRLVREGNNLCVIADAAPVAIERVVGKSPSTKEVPYYVRLAARVWRPVGLGVLVDTGAGYPPAPDHAIELSPKVGASISWLGEGVPHRVELVVPALTTVCMSRFDIVKLHNAR
jgi:hypothetical protein